MAVNFKFFFTTIYAIFSNPGPALGLVMKKKYWLPLLLFLIFILGLFFYLQFPIEMNQMTDSARISGQFSEEQISYLEGAPLFARLMTMVLKLLGLLFTLTMGAFFVYLFFGIAQTGGVFVNYFSLVTGASFIDILLPSILRIISYIVPMDVTGYFSLAFYIPGLDPSSYAALLFSNISLFSIWYAIAIAAGVANFSGKGYKQCLRISIYYFLFRILIQAAFTYILIKITTMPVM